MRRHRPAVARPLVLVLLLALALAPGIEALGHHGPDCHLRTPQHCDACQLFAPAAGPQTAPALATPGQAVGDVAPAAVWRTGRLVEPESGGRAPPLTLLL
jgi:hypothetical protein